MGEAGNVRSSTCSHVLLIRSVECLSLSLSWQGLPQHLQSRVIHASFACYYCARLDKCAHESERDGLFLSQMGFAVFYSNVLSMSSS